MREVQKRARLQVVEELRKASCKHELEPSPKGMGRTLTIDGEEGHTTKTCQSCEESSRNGIHAPTKVFDQGETEGCAYPGFSWTKATML